MNNMYSFFSRLRHSPIPRRAAVTLVALGTLAWSSLAFCGAIHDAARSGDLAKVKTLLQDNPDLVFSKDDMGATPLHYAAGHGHRDVAELLLASKAEVNAKDNDGWTPLHYAAYQGHKDLAELLLANKAEVNAHGNNGSTPLHYAAANGYGDVAELLRQHGGQDVSAVMPPAPTASALGNRPSAARFAREIKNGTNRESITALTDQTRLMQLASTLPAAELRVLAVGKITDETFLLARSREDSSAAVRAAAVRAMKSHDMLLEVATNSYYGDLRRLGESFLRSDSKARAKIRAADKARVKQIKKIAAKKTRPETLVDIALNGKFDIVCLAAANRLSDQSLLARVAMKTKDREVAKAALARLNDARALGVVAGSADDRAVRIAATVSQNSTNWNEVFSKATQVGDSKSLGDAVAAVSLSAAQSGIRDVVTATCLTLIRRGDESRIPELVDLLDRYGDVPLAEDYLNCGQPDLHNAASSWASRHGYSIGTGYGSHRATWGSRR